MVGPSKSEMEKVRNEVAIANADNSSSEGLSDVELGRGLRTKVRKITSDEEPDAEKVEN